jgi:hypothetical protein
MQTSLSPIFGVHFPVINITTADNYSEACRPLEEFIKEIPVEKQREFFGRAINLLPSFSEFWNFGKGGPEERETPEEEAEHYHIINSVLAMAESFSEELIKGDLVWLQEEWDPNMEGLWYYTVEGLFNPHMAE